MEPQGGRKLRQANRLVWPILSGTKRTYLNGRRCRRGSHAPGPDSDLSRAVPQSLRTHGLILRDHTERQFCVEGSFETRSECACVLCCRNGFSLPPLLLTKSVLHCVCLPGADPNAVLTQPDSLGWTPLHFACRSPLDSNHSLRHDGTYPCFVSILRSRASTSMVCSLRFENVKHAQLLLDFGADPLLETSDGRTGRRIPPPCPPSTPQISQ